MLVYTDRILELFGVSGKIYRFDIYSFDSFDDLKTAFKQKFPALYLFTKIGTDGENCTHDLIYLGETGDLFVCSVCGSGVIKALILGLPIVATDTPELNELLKNGESALITPDTEEDLYTGIKRMLDEPELLEQYRQKGEARGWDFDIEALMVPVENLLMN